jgi:hypothetical protein
MNSKKRRQSNREIGDETGLTRRRMLQALGAGAAVVTMSRRGVLVAAMTGGETDAAHPVSPNLEPFNLEDVRLLDGSFLQAQKRDEKYLLQLEPDRMLHNFRVNAGLEPKAPVYGGWESVLIWADIRAHGHTLGHYLTACSLMYASTNNDAFKKRCDYIVGELQECQNAGKTGLVCAFPDKTAQFENMVAGRPTVGVPWYTMTGPRRQRET